MMKLRVLTWEIYRVIYKSYYTTPGINGKVRLLPIQQIFYKVIYPHYFYTVPARGAGRRLPIEWIVDCRL